MASKTATLYIHYKKADGTWAYAESVVKANGRITTLSVLVEGKEKHHPEARYKVSWYESGRKRFDEDDTSEPVREQVDSAFSLFAHS